MKYILVFFLVLMSAISADAQTPTAKMSYSKQMPSCDFVERPQLSDNWSLSLAGGFYHPMFYDLQYLVDCSSVVGSLELRKQLTPIVGLGLEGDVYCGLSHAERQDPRSVIGPMIHVNLMNLFGGYKGRPRLFEMEAGFMPAWGHLYRGVADYRIPDEDYFATKYALDFNFYLGNSRSWSLSLKPAMTLDVTSRPPEPKKYEHLDFPQIYNGYQLKKSDLQLYVGCTYHFRGHGGKRGFNCVTAPVNNDEINRLNEIVRFLRNDVEERDRQIRELRRENGALKQENDALKGVK